MRLRGVAQQQVSVLITLGAIILMVAVAFALGGCATGKPDAETAFKVSGESLKAVGKQFVATSVAFKSGCDAGTLKSDACAQFGAFQKDFKKAYPEAVALWHIAVGAAFDTGDVETRIIHMAANLAAFAAQVAVKYGGD